MQPWQIILWPVSMLYGLGVSIHQWLYSSGFLKSQRYDLPVISVGNLSMGGTGKSPHIVYLTALLKNTFKTAILSRGYKRKSKGLQYAERNSTAALVGDEPLMFKRKFPDVTVAVAESRASAIPEVLMKQSDIQLILLDDAFQHYSIEPGVNILLTDHRSLFTDDYLLPVGELREWKNGYKRATHIIVTKCPYPLEQKKKDAIISKINPTADQKVFFSHLGYHHPYKFDAPQQRLKIEKDHEVLLLTGIANSEALENYLKTKVDVMYRQYYPDHHWYELSDLRDILISWENIETEKKIILTTEKDAMRLEMYRDWMRKNNLEIYVLPVQVFFDEKERDTFHNEMISYIEKYYPHIPDEDVDNINIA